MSDDPRVTVPAELVDAEPMSDELFIALDSAIKRERARRKTTPRDSDHHPIPDAAIEAAAEAIRRHNEDGYGCSVCNATGPFGNTSHQAFAALEAAMPAIREHIAQEIEAQSPKVGGMLSGAHAGGYRDASHQAAFRAGFRAARQEEDDV